MRFVVAAYFALAAFNPPGWTFCVAESGQDVWISDVFAPVHSRERLEAAFVSLLRGQGAVNPVAQCPAPNAEKAEVFNAQFVAAEFHRKLGQRMHPLDMPARAR